MPLPKSLAGQIITGVLFAAFIVGVVWVVQPRSDAELRSIATDRGFTVLSVNAGGVPYRIEVEFGKGCPGTLVIPPGGSEVYLETTREGHQSRIADPRATDLLKFATFKDCR